MDFITDITYLRVLRAANHISWYGDYSQNVSKEKDYRLLINADFSSSEIIQSGFYNSFCVEIDIGLLALNTIAKSDELKNIDKDTSKLIETKENGGVKKKN